MEHNAWMVLGDKMLTCNLKFHMSSDMHFGNDMSSDGLKVLALYLLTGLVEPMMMTNCQMGCDGGKILI
jgi:hypothetical protein